MIEDPPLLTVRRRITRPAAKKVQAFAGAQTGNVVDAMEGRGALDWQVKPLDPATAGVVGTALTCRTGPDDNLGLIAALEFAKPGDILVVATEGFSRSAVTGDLVMGMARNRGVLALVTDGMVRDVTGILKVGLPVFCRGVTPNSPVKTGPGWVGLPVVIGDVTIESGDIVLGDRDGVVIVPRKDIDAVLERLARVRAAEAEAEAKVNAGRDGMDAVKAMLASNRTRYLD